jgi:hypothetical protein
VLAPAASCFVCSFLIELLQLEYDREQSKSSKLMSQMWDLTVDIVQINLIL